MKKFKVQFIIFLVLFLLAEIVLRITGMKSGTLIDDFGIVTGSTRVKDTVSLSLA